MRNCRISVFTLMIVAELSGNSPPPDSTCEGYGAWQVQSNVRSDATGRSNITYPETNATYWGTFLSGTAGTAVTIRGQFPKARYMALQVYDESRNVVGAIADQEITPDPNQNNPFVSGSSQGTYTVQLVFGRQPRTARPNTIYTGGLSEVVLLYRVYYPNQADDLKGGTFSPELPEIVQNGQLLASCPPRPVIYPENATVWGRLDEADWTGTPPTDPVYAPPNPPEWGITADNRYRGLYASADMGYLSSVVSRKYLLAPYSYDVVVLRLRAPSFPNTQAGEPPYLATSAQQVRLWSVCQNDATTTGVVRCVSDHEAASQNGLATFVISDPSKRPADQTLLQHGARWMPWGALLPGDHVFDKNGNQVGQEQGAHYTGMVLYRQGLANPSFTQSIEAVAQLPRSSWQAAMGDYWPEIGYCTSASFETFGAGCIGR